MNQISNLTQRREQVLNRVMALFYPAGRPAHRHEVERFRKSARRVVADCHQNIEGFTNDEWFLDAICVLTNNRVSTPEERAGRAALVRKDGAAI